MSSAMELSNVWKQILTRPTLDGRRPPNEVRTSAEQNNDATIARSGRLESTVDLPPVRSSVEERRGRCNEAWGPLIAQTTRFGTTIVAGFWPTGECREREVGLFGRYVV